APLVVQAGPDRGVERPENTPAAVLGGRGTDPDRSPGPAHPLQIFLAQALALVLDQVEVGQRHDPPVGPYRPDLLYLQHPAGGDPGPRAQRIEPELHIFARLRLSGHDRANTAPHPAIPSDLLGLATVWEPPGTVRNRARGRLGGLDHREYLEANQIAPPLHPQVEQRRIAGLHELEAAIQAAVVNHPAVNLRKPLGQHPPVGRRPARKQAAVRKGTARSPCKAWDQIARRRRGIPGAIERDSDYVG